MGLFDMFKKKVASVVSSEVVPQNVAAVHAEVTEDDSSDDSDSDSDGDDVDVDEGAPDFAGFDPAKEEEFFHAVLHMESDGMYGGTDESRAEIESRFEIRSRRHWQHVRDSVFNAMAQRIGSHEEVQQRQMNWRQAQMQAATMQNQAAARASGEVNPVEGVTLESWAAMNAAIAGGANGEDVVRGAGISMDRWQRVSAEWNARMSRDTTFSITTIYGQAFQAASQGKFANNVRDANAARAANAELTLPLPMSYEQYYDLLLQQGFAAKQGKDPIASLKEAGLSVVDWTDLGTVMGYAFHRDAARNHGYYNEIHTRLDAKYAAMNPGVKPDLDISF